MYLSSWTALCFKTSSQPVYRDFATIQDNTTLQVILPGNFTGASWEVQMGKVQLTNAIKLFRKQVRAVS